MARTPVGTHVQPRTDTALFAHIAARLSGISGRQLDAWAAKLGVLAGAQAIRRAPHTAERLDGVAARERVVRRWALLDYDALNFFLAVVTLRCSGPRDAALRGLERVRGVVDLLALDDGAVLAHVIYEDRREQQVLRTALGEFADVGAWRVVDERRPSASISTFRQLARLAAREEKLRR